MPLNTWGETSSKEMKFKVNMMKKIVTISLVALSALVFAQQGGPAPVAATGGRGVAQSEDGRRAEFKFEAAKFVRENVVRVRGNAEFAQARGENARPVRINVREVARLGANNNVAEFSGPAMMVLPPAQEGGEPRRIEGVAQFRVVNRSVPNGGTEQQPDQYRINFRNADGSVTFQFAGLVNRGDLFVRTTGGGGN